MWYFMALAVGGIETIGIRVAYPDYRARIVEVMAMRKWEFGGVASIALTNREISTSVACRALTAS